jgi:hypothetical protein
MLGFNLDNMLLARFSFELNFSFELSLMTCMLGFNLDNMLLARFSFELNFSFELSLMT